jgi:hypothetical protein
MRFNPERFLDAEFVPRERTIKVESLRDFFDPDDDGEKECTWTVRSLTGDELARCFEAESMHKDIGRVLDGLTSRREVAAKMRQAMGLDPETTAPEVAKRLQMLEFGSVKPKIDLAAAVKLGEAFPIEFYQLTQAITELTGLGHCLKKPEADSLETAA